MGSVRPELKTARGYELGEVVSALQKSIRRNKETEALYWAEELFISGYQRYLLYRLWIIAHEDVGPANPSLVQLVGGTYHCWLLHRKEKRDFAKSGENRVFNGNLVISLCRSPKCRVADDATQLILQRRERGNLWLDIPDYALDSHTKRGRELQRVFRHWVEVGSKCANLVTPDVSSGLTYKAQVEAIALALADEVDEPSLPPDPEVCERGLL